MALMQRLLHKASRAEAILRRGVAGKYVEVIAGGAKVCAFVPHPLPPEPPLEMDARRLLLE
ncbi:hypothetical protein D6779_02305 [Candidatus Parcubacteria bacterium]|nr:MAG: hypothetical protein D6779_02305 [Candidatus Parcubacteria bacterium]